MLPPSINVITCSVYKPNVDMSGARGTLGRDRLYKAALIRYRRLYAFGCSLERITVLLLAVVGAPVFSCQDKGANHRFIASFQA